MDPIVLKNVLDKNDFLRLHNYFNNNQALDDMPIDEFGRRLLSDKDHPILKEYSQKLLPLVRDYFNDQSILPSFSLFSEYSDKEISLFHHKDKNACTYTADLVLYQKEPWGIWVNNIEYILNPNEALLFMGEDQEHWRETISDNTDKIGLAFFHYVRPDHWWYGNANWK